LSAQDIVHGIHTDTAGGLKSICVCSRTKNSDFSPSAGGFVFERMLMAEHVYQHGFFDRFDQVRGISPLACALNSLRDSYEGIDYALAKMKIAQLFGLAFFRGDPDSINAADRPENTTDYKAMKLDGPKILDLDVGDRVEWLESKTPSMEFQQFQTLVIQLALKALDIPYSFFNESFTNYSGSRGARLLYEQSCKNRQADVVDLLDWLTQWRLAWLLANGELTEGEYLAANWEWVHSSMPGLDPLKEIEAKLRKLAAGMTTRRRLCKEEGEDYDEIKRELAEEQADLAELGLPTNVQPDNGLIKELVTDGAA
jgi:capsid protein